MLSTGNKKADSYDRSGFEVLQREFKSSCQFTRVLISALQERIHLENEYAKGLSKLHARLSKATTGLSGSVVNAWTQTLQSLEAEAKAHQTVSEKITTQLLPISKDFIATVEREFKPISSEVETVSSCLQTARREEWKNRKKAFNVYRLTCQNLSSAASGISNNNNRVERFDNGNIDAGSRTATLLLRKGNPQSPSAASSASFKRLERSTSLRRVATLSTSRPSMEINGSGSQSVLPSKAARSVWRAFFDLYRSSVASEEARIEWNSTLYQNTFKLFDLERLRLKTLQEILESYRSTITNSIQIMDKALQSSKEAVVGANADEDFLDFHGKAVVNGSLESEQSSTTVSSRLINHKLVLNHKLKPQPMAVVGTTQQYLLCLPGEEDSLYVPSEDMQHHSIRHAFQKRSLISDGAPRSVGNGELANSVKKCEKAAFARQLLMSIVEVLVRECQKEERTKQGLTNLVMVYSSKPVFTDDATLVEARRRLFSSRCRLAYLLACRARLASLFHHLSSSVHSNSLQNRLKSAGFSSLESDQTFSRRVDVNIPSDPPSVQLEWPPITSEVVNLESIPSTELDIVNPFLANDISRFSWMAHADSLFGSTGGSSLVGDEDDYIDDDDDDFINQTDNLKAPQSPVTVSVASDNSSKRENCVKKPISSPVKPTVEPSPIRSAGAVHRKTNSQITSSSTTTSKPANSTSSRLNSTPTKVQTSSKNQTPVKKTPQSTKTTPATIPAKAPTVGHSVASPTKQPERKLPASTKSVKPTPKTRISISKSKTLDTSRSKSASYVRTPNNTTAFSPILDDSDAFMDDDINEEVGKTAPSSPPQPLWQAKVQEKKRITLERVNGCGNKLDAKEMEIRRAADDEMTETVNAKEEEANIDKKKNPSGLLSRLVIRSNKQSKHNQRPQIVTPWRVEPSDDESLAAESSTTCVSTMPSSSPKEAQSPIEMWPSVASLHCIGWAKVTSNYTPQKYGELALLEGEIVSILQKTTSNWWMGEAGGKSGCFPVSHVEEF